MNLTQLKAFHFVAIEGSFTRAAERLCITQPAVTASITALEERHGVPLFHRQGRKVTLTHAGQRLAKITDRLFALEEEAEDYLEGIQGLKTGRLRMAIGSPYGLSSILRQFRESHPGIEIQLLPGNFKNVEELLLNDLADLAIQTEAPEMPGILRQPFQTHHLIAFCHRNHPMAAQEGSINLWQLANCPLILREQASITRRLFEEQCQALDLKIRPAIEAGSRESVEEMVRAGLGIGIVLSGELLNDPQLISFHIAECTKPVTDYLLYLEKRKNFNLIQALIRIL